MFKLLTVLVMVVVVGALFTMCTPADGDPPDVECPCFTTGDLDALYNQLIDTTALGCIEDEYSSSYGYPPYTYYVVEACDNPDLNCEESSDIRAGVGSEHPYIGGGIESNAWNADCYVLETDGPKYHIYDANLTRGEVKACSDIFKSSRWWQVCQ